MSYDRTRRSIYNTDLRTATAALTIRTMYINVLIVVVRAHRYYRFLRVKVLQLKLYEERDVEVNTKHLCIIQYNTYIIVNIIIIIV